MEPDSVDRSVDRRVVSVARRDGDLRSRATGYLLSPRLVLTAEYVVGPGRMSVGVLGREIGCTTHWIGARSNAALLLLDEAVDAAPQAEVEWGRLAADSYVLGSAVGFPVRDTGERSAVGGPRREELTGRLYPARRGGGYLVEGSNPWPPDPDAWLWMSGAAFIADGLLMGLVVRSEPSSGRLAIEPAWRLLREPGFLTALGHRPVLLTPSPYLPFERRYLAQVARLHGVLPQYGTRLGRGPRSDLPLDAAYVPLSVAEVAPDSGSNAAREAYSVEDVVARHERVFLVGGAGSGKTTLLQWLVSVYADRRVDTTGHAPEELVPFLLPLHRLLSDQDRLPSPERFLSGISDLLAVPADWLTRTLAAQRGLFLLDGLDEIPEAARRRAPRWTGELLAAFPGSRWVVASRSGDDAWGADLGFTTAVLNDMSERTVHNFVDRWFSADGPRSRSQADGDRLSLHATLREHPELAVLAANPLMCSIICTWGWDRRLPLRWIQLYDVLLSMMLGRWDQERGATPRLALSGAEQTQLLQAVAYWLLRNGLSAADRREYLSIVQRQLVSLPSAEQDAAAVGGLLLERTGILRSSAEGSVSFAHRTFRDFLAARAAVESADLSLLVANADRPQWEDVLRFAVGHSRPPEREHILSGLLDRADRERAESRRLEVLAFSCLDYAPVLEDELRQEVERRAARLLPPRSERERVLLKRIIPALPPLPPSGGGAAGRAPSPAGPVLRLGTPGTERPVSRYVLRARPAAPAPAPEPPPQLELRPLAPGVRELAVALSVATRIEPELIRAVRLRVLPHLDVGAESDLWFSDWVASRTADAIALRREVLPELRAELATVVAGCAPGDPFRDLWQVVTRVHAQLPPALALEEQLTWAYVTGGPDAREQFDLALRPALRALVEEGRTGIADWFAGAWGRLPPEVRETTTGWQLAALARRHAPEVELGAPAAPQSLDIDDVAVIAEELSDVALPVALHGSELVLGGPVSNAFGAVPVPDTDPRLVDVIVYADESDTATRAVRTVTVEPGQPVTVTVGDAGVRLRNARGTEYAVRRSRATPLRSSLPHPLTVLHVPDDAPAAALAFSPDGTLLATGGSTSDVWVWDVRTGRERAFLTRDGAVWALAFSPDGTRLAVAGAGGVVLWEHLNGERTEGVQSLGTVRALAFSPNGELLATGAQDGAVHLWRLDGFESIGLARAAHDGSVLAMVLPPDDEATVVVADAKNGAVRMWSASPDDPPLRTEIRHGSRVPAAAFSADGGLLATGGDDGTVRVWDRTSGTATRHVLDEAMDGARPLALSVGGDLLAVGGRDGAVRVFPLDRS
ncbi:NACHT domain-containing protein [Streptomyces sp. NBC_00433]